MASEYGGIISSVLGGGGITGFAGDIVGRGGSRREAGTERKRGIETEQLEIDEAGIAKILQDVLGGTEGLASIFGGEQTAGLYSGTVAAQASGDLLANLIGEIAKVTAKKTVRTGEDITRTSKAEESTKGLLPELGSAQQIKLSTGGAIFSIPGAVGALEGIEGND